MYIQCRGIGSCGVTFTCRRCTHIHTHVPLRTHIQVIIWICIYMSLYRVYCGVTSTLYIHTYTYSGVYAYTYDLKPKSISMRTNTTLNVVLPLHGWRCIYIHTHIRVCTHIHTTCNLNLYLWEPIPHWTWCYLYMVGVVYTYILIFGGVYTDIQVNICIYMSLYHIECGVPSTTVAPLRMGVWGVIIGT